VHLKKIFAKAIDQASPTDTSLLACQIFRKAAWSNYKAIVDESSDRDTVDLALRTLSEMHPVLKTVMAWMSQ